jgi:putative FmdB family regulatory protein
MPRRRPDGVIWRVSLGELRNRLGRSVDRSLKARILHHQTAAIGCIRSEPMCGGGGGGGWWWWLDRGSSETGGAAFVFLGPTDLTGCSRSVICRGKLSFSTQSSIAMPLFEYRCQSCSSEFELLVRGREKVTCPHCEGGELEKLFSVPAAVHMNGPALPMSRSCPPADAPPCSPSCCRLPMN